MGHAVLAVDEAVGASVSRWQWLLLGDGRSVRGRLAMGLPAREEGRGGADLVTYPAIAETCFGVS